MGGAVLSHPDPQEFAQTNVHRAAAEMRAAVAQALARLERGERNALDNLREAVCAFVLALRTSGSSREAAVEEVRTVMSQPSGSGTEHSILPPAREALVELSTHWCADQYGQE
jgi:hypothetical protein